MELLVKRDGTLLEKAEGKVFVDSDVPDFLKVARVVPQEEVKFLRQRSLDDDLLIADEKDYSETSAILHFNYSGGIVGKLAKLFSKTLNSNSIPGLWSGYRSALVQDPDTKKLFRLKGISLNPQNPISVEMSGGMYKIEGGQEKQSAEFEQKMSERFNKVLEDAGIEPVMRVKGMWKYPCLARRVRPAASVVEVKGDTRLDELLFIMERLALNKMYTRDTKDLENGMKRVEIGELTFHGEDFHKHAKNLFHNIGYVVGRLKRLMDKSGQTWSSDYEQTNAHIGNIALYNGTDKLRVGLVDFDASCDATELSRSQIKALQEREYTSIIATAQRGPISPRAITGKPLNKGIKVLHTPLRNGFIEGFQEGYSCENKDYTNEIDLSELQQVFSLLRAEGLFSIAPPRGSPISYI